MSLAGLCVELSVLKLSLIHFLSLVTISSHGFSLFQAMDCFITMNLSLPFAGILNDDEVVVEGSLDLLTCTEEGVVLNDASDEDDDDEEPGKVVESDTDHEG